MATVKAFLPDFEHLFAEEEILKLSISGKLAETLEDNGPQLKNFSDVVGLRDEAGNQPIHKVVQSGSTSDVIFLIQGNGWYASAKIIP